MMSEPGHGDGNPVGEAGAPTTLDAVWADLWSRLERGVTQRTDAFHACTLATVGEDGADARIVVLRHADRERAQLRFHTDRRSAKLAQLTQDARVCLLFHGQAMQLRLRGTARIEQDGALGDAAWAATGFMSRLCYLTEAAPGTPSAEPISGLASALMGAQAPLALTEPGRAHFALVTVEVQAIDWLQLFASGQRRAGFSRSGAGWMGNWLVP
jgi:hypothetical protein